MDLQGGVVRVTAYEEGSGDAGRRELRPVAERLVYRRPGERLSLTLKPDRPAYAPGDKVRLGVEATDEK